MQTDSLNTYSRSKENKRKKVSFYTSDNFSSTIKDRLEIEKHAKIPVIKNGNDLSLKSIKINRAFVTLHNTCPFDSFFQVCLTGSYDFKEIELQVSLPGSFH